MQEPHKIRYTEKFPKEQELIFDDFGKYREFFDKRFEELAEEWGFFTNKQTHTYSDWIHTSVKLRKDGSPIKYNPAKQLQTKEAREKQKIAFQSYQEKKKKEKEEENNRRKENYEKALKILLENGIDLSTLNISVKGVGWNKFIDLFVSSGLENE